MISTPPFMKYFLLLAAAVLLTNCQPSAPAEPETIRQEFYQLREYHFSSADQMATTEVYLEDAFVPAMNRLGYGPVGVFKPIEQESDSSLSLYTLVALDDLNVLSDLEGKLNEDEAYLTAGSAYLTAPFDNPPYQRLETIITKAFQDMPQMATPALTGPREERIYELRSYESATEAIFQNKVHMFNEGGEITLFDTLGFNAVFYSEVISGPSMPNLMYMTTHANAEARDANWQSFVNSPAWKDMSTDEFYQDNVSHIDIYLLYPTSYSDY